MLEIVIDGTANAKSRIRIKNKLTWLDNT
jgi:hypothetical protein